MFEVQIKNALKAAGLDESLWTQIKAENEGQVETAGSEFVAARNLQSEVDKRVTQALKTQEAKLRKEFDAELKKATEKKTENEKAPEKEPETMTAEQKRIQALEEANKALADKIDGLLTKVSAGDVSAKIRAELKKQGLKEDFESDIHVSDPEKIVEAVTGLKTRIDAHQQEVINQKLEAGELSPVKKGIAGQTVEEAQIIDYAKSIGKGGAPKNPDFVGKISSPDVPVTAAKAVATQ